MRRTAAGIEVISHQSLPVGGGVPLLPAAGALLGFRAVHIPVPVGMRPPQAVAAASSSKLHEISLAMMCYAAEHGALPPAYVADKTGKPLLSWRVLLLPYVGGAKLDFHMDEPWDSPHNASLIPQMPQVFKSPASLAGPGNTTYLAVRGPKTLFPGKDGIKLDTLRNPNETVMVLEASDAKAVVWTKPDDFQPDPKRPADGLGGAAPGFFQAAMADGSVRAISAGIAPAALTEMFNAHRDGAQK